MTQKRISELEKALEQCKKRLKHLRVSYICKENIGVLGDGTSPESHGIIKDIDSEIWLIEQALTEPKG